MTSFVVGSYFAVFVFFGFCQTESCIADDEVGGALVALQNLLALAYHLVVIVHAVGNVFGDLGEILLMLGAEADEFVFGLVNSLISFLTTGAPLLSSVVGQIIFRGAEGFVEVEETLAERSCQFFALSVMVLGKSVLASVALFLGFVKSEAVFIVIFFGLETGAFVYASE